MLDYTPQQSLNNAYNDTDRNLVDHTMSGAFSNRDLLIVKATSRWSHKSLKSEN